MQDNSVNDFIEEVTYLIKELTAYQSAKWKETIENYNNMMTSIADKAMHSYLGEAMQSISRLAEQMQKVAINLPKIELPEIHISEETKNAYKKLAYLEFLEKIKWPLFLLIDDDLVSLLEHYVYNGDYESDEVKQVILDFLSDDYILNLTAEWRNNKTLNSGRFDALGESIKLFINKYYYGCTALLSCQLEGIISDIYKMQMDAGRTFTTEDLKPAYEHYNPDKELNSKLRMTSEKNRLLAIVSETDAGFYYWNAVVKYLYKTILTSDEQMNQSDNPCRNKICHGIQLNYGTREHAVKSILIIDMTIKLGEEIKCILDSEDLE